MFCKQQSVPPKCLALCVNSSEGGEGFFEDYQGQASVCPGECQPLAAREGKLQGAAAKNMSGKGQRDSCALGPRPSKTDPKASSCSQVIKSCPRPKSKVTQKTPREKKIQQSKQIPHCSALGQKPAETRRQENAPQTKEGVNQPAQANNKDDRIGNKNIKQLV